MTGAPTTRRLRPLLTIAVMAIALVGCAELADPAERVASLRDQAAAERDAADGMLQAIADQVSDAEGQAAAARAIGDDLRATQLDAMIAQLTERLGEQRVWVQRWSRQHAAAEALLSRIEAEPAPGGDIIDTVLPMIPEPYRGVAATLATAAAGLWMRMRWRGAAGSLAQSIEDLKQRAPEVRDAITRHAADMRSIQTSEAKRAVNIAQGRRP